MSLVRFIFSKQIFENIPPPLKHYFYFKKSTFIKYLFYIDFSHFCLKPWWISDRNTWLNWWSTLQTTMRFSAKSVGVIRSAALNTNASNINKLVPKNHKIWRICCRTSQWPFNLALYWCLCPPPTNSVCHFPFYVSFSHGGTSTAACREQERDRGAQETEAGGETGKTCHSSSIEMCEYDETKLSFFVL